MTPSPGTHPHYEMSEPPPLTTSTLTWHSSLIPGYPGDPEAHREPISPLPGAPSPLRPPSNSFWQKGTYYLDLSVLSDLVDLDLLGIGQGVVQGLRLGLGHLSGGRRCGHDALCGETDALRAASRRAAPAHLWLPSLPRPQTPTEEERKFFIPRPESTCPNGEHGVRSAH